MHRLLASIVAALALSAAAVAPAAAQEVPGGSYLQSCSDVHVEGNQLVARCNRTNGGTSRSSIDLGSCRDGDLADNNGQLQCNRTGYNRYGNRHDGYDRNGNDRQRGGYRLPGGSYRQSCTDAAVDGNRLTATCTSPYGSRITSTVDLRNCNNVDIANRNGRLDCR